MKIEHLLAALRRTVLAALAIALFAGLATSANAQVVFDDAVNGNASGDGDAPTEVTFSLGSNIINGTVTSPDNTRNYYTFTIGAGQELSAINLDSISVSVGDPVVDNPADPGFFALVAGTTSVVPNSSDDLPDFVNLGGDLFAPADAGADLLARIADGGISSGSGFSNIGAGDYTFVIQQTGPEASSFSLDFQVTTAVPEPTSGILLAGLGLVGLARRRRR